MAGLVYILCAVTAFVCACLLLAAYRATANALLFWSGLCFAFLTLNNVMVVADRLVLPEVDLSTWRLVPALMGIMVLLWGMIWHGE